MLDWPPWNPRYWMGRWNILKTLLRMTEDVPQTVVVRFARAVLKRYGPNLTFRQVHQVRSFTLYFIVSNLWLIWYIVFHIRRGGLKGLLVAYPNEVFDDRWGNAIQEGRARLAQAPNIVLAYRSSMLKYRGGTTEIEVHDISKPPDTARLNLQFIVLLLKLGVERTVGIQEI